MVKQAYGWFFISLLVLPLGFILPTRIVLVLVYIYSCFALTISAQAFIAAAKANKHLEDGDANE